MAALKGDWKSIEDMPCIQRRISKIQRLETTLHVATAANKEDFVMNLLSWMRNNPTAENVTGATITAENVTLEAGNVIGSTVTAENVTQEAENVTVEAENVIGATLTADDVIENSALILAAAVGNVNIAKEMLNMFNRRTTPMGFLLMASISGHSQMVQYLYPMTNLVGDEKAEIFISCVKNDLYGKQK